ATCTPLLPVERVGVEPTTSCISGRNAPATPTLVVAGLHCGDICRTASRAGRFARRRLFPRAAPTNRPRRGSIRWMGKGLSPGTSPGLEVFRYVAFVRFSARAAAGPAAAAAPPAPAAG